MNRFSNQILNAVERCEIQECPYSGMFSAVTFEINKPQLYQILMIEYHELAKDIGYSLDLKMHMVLLLAVLSDKDLKELFDI